MGLLLYIIVNVTLDSDSPILDPDPTHLNPIPNPIYITKYQVHLVFLPLFWCTCMAINISVQYNGGISPDIIRLTLSYYTTIGEPF